ncbi:MAG: RNA 3'-terminal phosphate cyclase [Planctomycetota bacterium]|nr:RNA 3'-terminal phosphate cyclase [Planctomycetota bacterium]GIK52035.1 MAG: RNA 3'-terminal phosphate cyclase [Planctomycetota bacterium]
MLEIDGAKGEGGGQVLRTALSLSMVTGTPFRISNIRVNRENPGMMAQHLTAVKAAKAVSNAKVEGMREGSTELTFEPGVIGNGRYFYSVGTAGSTSLVLQTILPALMLAPGPSEITLEGGTHNPFAPPYDFLALTYLPALARMGPVVQATLERHGFYPAGGGRMKVDVQPVEELQGFELLERGDHVRTRARALVSNLSMTFAIRELDIIAQKLGLGAGDIHPESITDNSSAGNVVCIEVEHEQITEVFTAFGRRGITPEEFAEEALSESREYLASTAPVGRYLCDQLMLPLALAGGGRFRTVKPTRHAVTNAEVIRMFLPVDIQIAKLDDGSFEVAIGSQSV